MASPLSRNARSNKLTMADLRSLDLLGDQPRVFGSQWGAVINQPNVAILGCGRTEEARRCRQRHDRHSPPCPLRLEL